MPRVVLVTGATGYVGGRVVPKLLEAGYRVRATGRSREKLEGRDWAHHPDVELIPADMLERESLQEALRGCWAAYYFVHSMASEVSDFEKTDRTAAVNMARAAEQEGLERIIYLGGLGDRGEELSKHLRSRAEVADILGEGAVPLTCFRAGMILGSGSASFEMLRYLVERLPIMLTSHRALTQSQPIAIRNVLYYLTHCLEEPATIGRSYDIGGPDVLTYRDLVHTYAREAGLRQRIVVPLSFMSPSIAAQIIHFVTPIPAFLGRPLSKSLGADMIVRDSNRIRSIIPQELLTCGETIRLALARIDQQVVTTSWMDAGAIRPPEWGRYHDAPYAGGDVRDTWQKVLLRGEPDQVWECIRRIGGDNGWYYANWLWEARGFMDRLAGGHGTRRGRRDPEHIAVGDALDWWRVLDATPGKRLLLLAEIKLPGEATLDFRIQRRGEGVTELLQIASFLPRGVTGLLYWYSVYPLHALIFSGMLREIARLAEMEIVEGPMAVEAPPQRSR